MKSTLKAIFTILLVGAISCKQTEIKSDKQTYVKIQEVSKNNQTKPNMLNTEEKSSEKERKIKGINNAPTLQGAYFCLETKEIYLLSGNEKSIKNAYLATAKIIFKNIKIASQKATSSEYPLDPDYEAVLGKDKVVFAVMPSGNRYFTKNGQTYMCLNTNVEEYDFQLDPEVALAKALCLDYKIDANEKNMTKISQLETRSAIGFKHRNEEMVAIVERNFNIIGSVPVGKVALKLDNFVELVFTPKKGKTFKLEAVK